MQKDFIEKWVINLSNQAGSEVKTFNVPFPLGENQENITINTNKPSKSTKEKIINQAFKFHSQGNISEAIKYYQYFIDQGFKDHRVLSNYGSILKSIGKTPKKAPEISFLDQKNDEFLEDNIYSEIGNEEEF